MDTMQRHNQVTHSVSCQLWGIQVTCIVTYETPYTVVVCITVGGIPLGDMRPVLAASSSTKHTPHARGGVHQSQPHACRKARAPRILRHLAHG